MNEEVTWTISLDCPPGDPRPGDLIGGVVEGLGLPESQTKHDGAVSTLFGNWIWKITTTQEKHDEVKEVLGDRITKLYNAGLIRYGEW